MCDIFNPLKFGILIKEKYLPKDHYPYTVIYIGFSSYAYGFMVTIHM